MVPKLRVYFDFCCPYCYLAWGYMKRVKETVSIDDYWVGWEIHPETPKEGAQIQEVVPSANLEERRKRLNDLGAAVGLMPGDKTFVPNTRLALEANEFAIEHGKMHDWVDAVYEANFVANHNIGDAEVLLAIAGRLGLNTELLKERLDSGHYRQTVLEHDRECMDRQLEWVPTVFADEAMVIEGAFDYEQFEQAVLALK